METSIFWTDRETAVISTDEPKWHRKIRKLKEEYPDKVRIKNEPENNDGNMVAEFPVIWSRIMPKKTVVLSDEQIAVRTERLRNLNEKRRDNLVNQNISE